MFISYHFILFLLLLFLLYYLIPGKGQWVLLLLASLAFYVYADIRYFAFILITASTVYGTAVWLGQYDRRERQRGHEREEGPKAFRREIHKRKKRVLILCLLTNLCILAVVRYGNFFIANLNFFREQAEAETFSPVDFIIPLGISFYTFQALGYLLDVYWGKCPVQRNYFRFLLFVTFFPQLVQGPISRYGDLSQTLYGEHPFDGRQILFGLERILWGYFKKLVVADRFAIAVTALTEDPGYYTGGFVFVGMMFYALQLYADFTGGIDITIGIAQVLGIRLEENFDHPYFSKNISEYWRRWHISMGTWFRDYVFYPCSISHPVKKITSLCKKHMGKAAARRAGVYIASIAVWSATGIWHGAEWRFVVWGLANGVIILVSQECEPLYRRFHQRYPNAAHSKMYSGFQMIRTFLLMSCLRLFDLYGSVRGTLRQFVQMFTQTGKHPVTRQELLDLGLGVSDYIILTAGAIILLWVSIIGRRQSVRKMLSDQPFEIRYCIYAVLFFAVILLGNYGHGYDVQQFIYNQF